MIKIPLKNLGLVIQDHYNRVCTDVKKQKGLISKVNSELNIPNISKGQLSFYRDLLNDLAQNNNPYDLITGPPEYLKNRVDYYQKKYKSTLNDLFKTRLLEKVFCYSNYKWNPYALASELSVNVCPYCNRQYTFTVSGNRTGNTRPQFDHFYDKATYPYLSLSFYNLIPSCGICNSNLKGTKQFCITSHINPYVEGFEDDVSFSIKPNNIQFINGTSSAYTVELKESPTADVNKIKRIKENVRVFRLEELYNQHKDYINEIIIKSKIYNTEYLESLYNQYPNLFSNINDVKRLVLSNYTVESELSKRPLSKLTRDISKELGLFI